MTEREYVETLRDAAADSLDHIRETTSDNWPKYRRWRDLRDHMSIHTFIRLCDAWLEKDSAALGEGT